MAAIKILHLSNILAGSTSIDPNGNIGCRALYQQLKFWLTKNEIKNKINYIVVAGGLTADGSAESFTEAKEVLRGLADELLIEDDGKIRYNRVLIVPGGNDVAWKGNDLDFTEFASFYKDFYGEEIHKSVQPFSPEEAIFRDLKDLTMIGVCYWDLPAGHPQFKEHKIRMLSKIQEVISKAQFNIPRLDYFGCTPKLLVSACTPLFYLDKDSLAQVNKIRNVFETMLKISLHLFGEGSATSLLPEPTGFSHISLGTGYTSSDIFWPLRMNLLEINNDAIEDKENAHGDSFLKNRIIVRSALDTDPISFVHINGQLDAYFSKPHEKQSEKVLYQSYLRELEEIIFEQNMKYIVVTGFPGAGKRSFFNFITQQRKWRDEDISVVDIHLDDYSTKKFKKELAKAQKQIKAIKNRWKVIVAIYDPHYGTLEGQNKEQLRDLLTANDPYHILGPYAVLHFLTSLDFTLAFDPVEKKTQKWILPPLEPEVIEGLVKTYSCRVPVAHDEIHTITGGYSGFSRLLLDAATGAFKEYSGSDPMHERICSDVLNKAINSKKVKAEADLHKVNIRNMNAGDDILRYIEKKVNDQKAGMALNGNTRHMKVFIDVDELRKGIDDQAKKENCIRTLNRLAVAEILQQESSNRYRLRVIAPFLTRVETSSYNPVPARITEKGVKPSMTTLPRLNRIAYPADFVIITALEEERDAILAKLPLGYTRLDPSDDDIFDYYYSELPVTFPQGRKGDYRVVVMPLIKMGPMDAAIAATQAIKKWNPRFLMVVGIAGGLAAAGVNIGDVLIADEVIYYDQQKLRPSGPEPRWRPFNISQLMLGRATNFRDDQYYDLITETRPEEGQPRRRIGNIATGDKVFADGKTLPSYLKIFPKLIGAEMEAGGAALASFQSVKPTPFFMVRCVSDLADDKKDSQTVDRWRNYVCDVAASYALGLLMSGPVSASVPERQFSGLVPLKLDLPSTMNDNETRDRGQELSEEDLRRLADLLKRTGKANSGKRETLFESIIVNPDEFEFRSDTTAPDFALLLVHRLYERGDKEALRRLCRELEATLKGEFTEQLAAIKEKL